MKRMRGLLLAVAALAAFSATLSLGFWQWGRAQQKLALHASIEQRGQLPPLDERALLTAANPAQLHHRQVELRGEWVAGHTVFLDNRQLHGRVGFYVVTPLRLADGAAVLVQRGWAPRDFNQRDRLPPVQTPAGPVVVHGRLAPPPAKLYEFDPAAQGPIRQNLDLAQFRAETRLALLELSVQQTGAASEGLLREWPEVASGAGKNWGYAFQWWALSGLIAVLYVWFQFIVPRRRRHHA
jgi:surfeit locus 1 family protein